MTQRRDIPSIPDNVSPDLRRALVRMREELQRFMGTRGSDPALLTSSGGTVNNTIVIPGGAGGGGGTGEEPDLTAPPTVTDLAVTAGITNVIVTWTGITYTQGRGHKQVVIYAVQKDPGDATLPTFPGDAGIVAVAPDALTIIAIPSEPNRRWHVWAKFQTIDDVLSVSPAGGTNGVSATTGTDVAQLLEVLAGEITESELYAALNTRIDLIDGEAPGSVNARIQTEVTNRTTALLAEANARELADDTFAAVGALLVSSAQDQAAAILSEANARTLADGTVNGALSILGLQGSNQGAAISLEQLTRSTSDETLASLVLAQAATLNGNSAAILIEQVTRVTNDEALSSQTIALAAEFADSAAALEIERTTRASADEATSAQTTTLAAATGASAAGLIVEQLARTTSDEAVSSQITSLAATTGGNAAAIVTEQTARTTEDSAIATSVTTLQAQAGEASASVIGLQQVVADADSSLAISVQGLKATFEGQSAAILVEQQARADADSASASQLTALAAEFGDTAAALQVEQLTRATSDEAVSAQTVTLSAATGSNAAALQVEQTARTTSDEAVSTQTTTLAAATAGNTAGIVEEISVRTTADSATASSVSGLAAATGAASAGILVEQQARATADEASASRLSSMSAALGANAAAIVTEQVARADETSALASQVTTLQVDVAGNTSAIQVVETTVADLDSTTATQLTTLQSRLGNFGANLLVNSSFELDLDSSGIADNWISYNGGTATGRVRTIDATKSVVGTKSQKVTHATSGGTTSDRTGVRQDTPVQASWIGKTMTISASVAGTVGARAVVFLDFTNSGGSGTGVSVTVPLVLTSETEFTRLSGSATVPATAATMRCFVWVDSSAGATNLWVDAAQAQIGELTGYVPSPDTAALQQEITTRATETGGLFAQYTVKMDLAGYVTGFGLTSSLVSGGTPTSTFLVSVDKFAVATPASAVENWTASTAYELNEIRGISGAINKLLICKQPGTSGASAPSIAGAIGTIVTDGGVKWQIASRVPFAVLTTPTTINGVSVPAGVYLDAAYVLNATIQNAQIANNAVDNSKIVDLEVGKLTAGSLSVGQYIQSGNYVASTSGWRINADGFAEFGSASIRGQLTASQIDTRELTIKDAAGTVIFSSGVSLNYSRVGGVGRPDDYATSGDPNLITDPNFEKQAAGAVHWALPTGGSITATQGEPQGTRTTAGLVINAASEIRDAQNLSYSPVNVGDIIYYTARVKRSATFNGSAFVGFICYAADKSTQVAFPGSTNLNLLPAETWTTVTGQITVPNTTSPTLLPAYIRGWISVRNDATAGVLNVSDFYLGRVPKRITTSNASTYIADAAIGNAQIGGTIQSDDYVAGSSGWAISKAGAAEFNTGTFRGALAAATGTFAGSLSAATGTFAGSLSAATGTFAGSLSAATGSFSGSLTASAISAVDTINIAGEAVIVPRFVSAATGLSLPGGGGWTSALTTAVLTLPATTPGSVVLTLSISLVRAPDGASGNFFSNVVRILRQVSAGASGSGTAIMTETVAYDGVFTISLQDVPGAGTWKYEVQARCAGPLVSNTGTANYRTLLALGAKR